MTEREDLRYWMPCDIVGERRVGAEIDLRFWPAHVEALRPRRAGRRTGRITVWDPPSAFEWTWGGDDLRFELAPTDAGTRLTFTTWLADPDAAAQSAGGYHVCLDLLEELLERASRAAKLTDPQVQADADRWTAAYAEVLASRT